MFTEIPFQSEITFGSLAGGLAEAVDLRVTLEIEATTATGFDDNRVRTVSENAATLKFEQSGFEGT
ncbi:MAG: hypothetical protein ACOYBY_18160 [Dermatophilaceae bacterium]